MVHFPGLVSSSQLYGNDYACCRGRSIEISAFHDFRFVVSIRLLFHFQSAYYELAQLSTRLIAMFIIETIMNAAIQP